MSPCSGDSFKDKIKTAVSLLQHDMIICRRFLSTNTFGIHLYRPSCHISPNTFLGCNLIPPLATQSIRISALATDGPQWILETINIRLLIYSTTTLYSTIRYHLLHPIWISISIFTSNLLKYLLFTKYLTWVFKKSAAFHLPIWHFQYFNDPFLYLVFQCLSASLPFLPNYLHHKPHLHSIPCHFLLFLLFPLESILICLSTF